MRRNIGSLVSFYFEFVDKIIIFKSFPRSRRTNRKTRNRFILILLIVDTFGMTLIEFFVVL